MNPLTVNYQSTKSDSMSLIYCGFTQRSNANVILSLVYRHTFLLPNLIIFIPSQVYVINAYTEKNFY